ncbi:START domain-containing protein [Arsukibacterium sp.]|uniref:START domain-containing protein n=1 Tax=Arsukibacterium sp. TaxID=1977258 RepID=UPI00299E7DD6|nr:START domain-containing protein [Arsukibacterium sp.]
MFLSVSAFLSVATVAQDHDWQLYKAESGVRVEYRRKTANLLEIKAQTEVNADTGAFIHLLEDTGNIDKWVPNADKAELLSHPDPATYIVHTFFKAPWPVSDRDMVTRSVWTTDEKSGELILDVQDLGDKYPDVAGYIRMQRVQARWTLTPQADGKLLIRYQGQADPAGSLPNFIADKVALKSLFKTFKALPRVLQNYQQSHPAVADTTSTNPVPDQLRLRYYPG